MPPGSHRSSRKSTPTCTAPVSDFDLPLDIAATAFRQRVWDALRRIPYGETRSYSDIAEAVGSPRAVRAVASACATNPVALAIPCHRVVQKGGALAGYRWGLPRKAALLDDEAHHTGVNAGVVNTAPVVKADGAAVAAEPANVKRSRQSHPPPIWITPLEHADDLAILELPFKAPFDWPRLLRFFAGRATPGVEAVEDGAYRRAIDWAGDSGTLTVRLHPRKRCIVASIEGPAGRHAEALAAPIARMFDLHADPKNIGAHFAADPWLAPLIEAAPGLRVPGAWSGFELVVRAIVGQQVSVKAATTIIGRLVQRAGQRIEDHPHEHTAWRFPTPAALAAVGSGADRHAGQARSGIAGLGAAVASGAVPLDSHAAADTVDTDALRAALLALPGIGPWTVEYVAMRAWRDADAWPAWDLVLMQSICRPRPITVRPTQQRSRTDAWRPWRAYAAMHLVERSGGPRGRGARRLAQAALAGRARIAREALAA